jgi:DUF1365 family protein
MTAASPSDAALYEGTLRHRRSEHAAHAFAMDVFFAYLDVDQIDSTFRGLPLWSSRRAAPIRFHRHDYLDGTDRPLGDAVRDLVTDRTGRRPSGRLSMLTQLRTLGWVFNPLTIYYCWAERSDRLETIVLEVTNTPWRDRCWYVVTVDPTQPTGPWLFPKAMHVSPFLDMDLSYRLRAGAPGERLALRLEDRRGDATVFAADLALRRVPLTKANALRVPLRHPLLTWRVSASIYRHAARLWRTGAPVHRRPAGSSPARQEEEVA